MPNIQVLDPHVADLIAAGEVVERPASVVKELLENAIDAGASKVTVEIQHGGMTFLRVTDDGKGIPAPELKTAFLRHATSKLRCEQDLEAIGTLGFRGEALAAIAAVSRVEVMSRTPEGDLGASLALEGGVPGEVEEAGCPLGTTLVVRDLFYNTPARLKFMKKDAAEGAAVFAAVQRTALSHPELSVKFIRDGKQELLTPGDGQLKSAVYAVLGRELALGFREVASAGEDMSVTGFVSLPACCRGSRNYQFFFVNGRPVKSRILTAALEEAYKNQKMVGKFPGCVLHLGTKLSAVDVNVHPAKTEVKFWNERSAFSAVYHAVLSALERDSSHPQAVLSGPSNGARRTVGEIQMKGSEVYEDGIPGVRKRDTVTGNQLQLHIPPASPLGGGGRDAARGGSLRLPAAGSSPKVPLPTAVRVHSSAYTPPMPALREKSLPPQKEKAEPPEALPGKNMEAGGTPSPAPPLTRPSVVPEAPRSPKDLPPADGTGEREIPWRLAGEVLDTYLIVERGDTVFLIDKHAAHERMNFDRMRAEDYDPMAQTLLTPVLCRLAPEAREALLSRRTLLEQFGFDVDELGGELAVRQAPFDLDPEDVPAALEELAGKLLAGGSPTPQEARDELLHTMACKAAIKGGWHTSPQELERVAQAVMSGQVKYCPHGRPVAIQLTKKELEKQFKRA